MESISFWLNIQITIKVVYRRLQAPLPCFDKGSEWQALIFLGNK